MRNTITLWPEGGSDGVARLKMLRKEIDGLDDALLELVERRLELSLKISALKEKDDGRLKLRPRREAGIVGRLTARGRRATPELIAHLWRELMSHGLQAQARTELALWGKLDPDSLREQVRRRFGWAAPIVWAREPGDALDRACRSETVAVIENSPFNSWWTRLADEPGLSIFDTIPIAGGGIGAFMIGRVAPEDVPGDQRYCVLDAEILKDRLDRGDRIEAVAAAGALRLCHMPADEAGEGKARAAEALRQDAAR
jgi:chorismate mutase